MMFKYVLKKTVLVGIFAVPFIPLIFFNDLPIPLITGKNFVFRILIEILLGLWVLLAIYDKKYRPKLSLISGAIISFIAIITVADFLGADPYRSFWGDFQRMEGLITLLHLLAYFFVVGTVLNTKKLWDSFFNKSIWVSVALSVIALFQLAGWLSINTDTGRLDSTLGNATYFALYILLHIFLALFMMAHSSRVKTRFLYGGVILLELFILYFTSTRSAVLGLMGGLFVIAVLTYLFDHEHKTLKRVAVGLVLGIVFVVGGFIVMKNQPFIKNNLILNRFSGISIGKIQDQARYHLWSISIQGFKDNPVLGQGQENFNLIFNKYYNPSLYNDEVIFSRSHNVLSEWLVSGGILGLLSYLSIYMAMLYYIWFRKNESWTITEKNILTGLISAYAVNIFFLFDNISSYIIFFSLLAYVHSQSTDVEKKPAKDKNKNQKLKIKSITAVAVFMGIALVIYFVNVKAISAGYYYKKGIDLLYNNSLESYEVLNKALSLNSFGNSEIRKEIAISMTYPPRLSEVDKAIKDRFFEFALLGMSKDLESSPDDANVHYLMGSLLYSYGKYDEAIESLKKSSELAPNKQVFLLKLRDVYFAQREFEKAYDIAKQTYELEPGFSKAHLAYAISMMYVDIPITSVEFKNSVNILKDRVATVPHDNQARIALAIAYQKMGQVEKFIEEIEKAVEYEPSLMQESQLWIDQIRRGRAVQ